MIGPFERKAFYRVRFRASDAENAGRHLGHMIITPDMKMWLTLQQQDLDLVRLPHVRPQMLIDPRTLVERYDNDGLYFEHQGPLREMVDA